MPEVIQQTIKAEHILGAAIMFVHPTTGNRYYGVCEKQGGSDQNFVVYRRRPGQVDFEYVEQLDGKGLDADAFITMGGAVINLDGSLEIWASGQPKGQPDTSGTGFDAIGKIVPGVDDPWAFPKAVTAIPVPNKIRLNPPEGYRPYGANQSFVISAEVVDGQPVYFFAQEGWGYSPENKGFGEYVFKQVGNQRAEYVYYNGLDVPDGRGDLYTPGNGKLYITGNENDDDKLPSVYEVPGYVPFGSTVYVGGGSSTGGSSDPQLAQKVANLEQQLADTIKLANKALERANYVKSVFDPLWEIVGALEARGIGISRDEAWQLAINATFAEVTTEGTGTRLAIKSLAGSSNVDASAREIANEALKRAGDAKTIAGQATEQMGTAAKAAIDNWLAESIAYRDKRLLNLIWDRGVKLARFLKVPGAATAPINDQKNLEV